MFLVYDKYIYEYASNAEVISVMHLNVIYAEILMVITLYFIDLLDGKKNVHFLKYMLFWSIISDIHDAAYKYLIRSEDI